MNKTGATRKMVPAEYYDDDDEETNNGDSELNLWVETEPRIRIVNMGSGAGLNGADFDIQLDEPLSGWLQGLNQVITQYKKGPIVQQHIRNFFTTRPDLFEAILKLFANAPGNSNPKPASCAYLIVKELESYLDSIDPMLRHTLLTLLDDNVKMVAFSFFHPHAALFQIAVKVFDLISSKHLFTGRIRNLIAEARYKDAGQICHELRLYEGFDIHDFVVPLILQDKMTIAEQYLAKAKHMQAPLIVFFDGWLNYDQPLSQYLDEYLSERYVPEVNYSKLQARKTLKKLVKRLADMYKIPADQTPHLMQMNDYGKLQLFLFKKYIEKSLSDWDEFIKENVQPHQTELVLELINTCAEHDDYTETLKWVEYFNVSKEQYPYNLQLHLDGERQERSISPAQNQSSLEYYTIEETRIHLIDTRDNYYRMISDLYRFSLIGFDAEWKFGTNDLSVIQLATSIRVYLIDVRQLLHLEKNEWNKLGRKVFSNEEIIKLGFSQEGDIAMLKRCLPALGLEYEKYTSYRDLQKIWRFMITVEGFRFPYPDDSLIKHDLKNLVQLCLGKMLDKSQQFSNWSRRPLTKEQICYAAADAASLLDLFNVMRRQAQRLNIDLTGDYKKFK